MFVAARLGNEGADSKNSKLLIGSEKIKKSD